MEKMGHYIYLYSDPDTNEIFYVGKGMNNRAFSHLNEKKESEKVLKITELKKQNKTPKIEILLHGLENIETAKKIEAAIIDLLGIGNLTNKIRGHESSEFGRMSIDEIRALYERKPVKISEPSLLIRINQLFRYTMTPTELYDATRGVWTVGVDREKVKYAFSVYHGIIQEVYEISQWFKAYTTFSTLPRTLEKTKKHRWEFIGNIAKDKIRDKYLHKSVEDYFSPGNSNPIQYLNIK